ncbi:MAG: hypothetical protein Q9211_001860 [Gyalolechia sp. 1 TL-2023]
MPQRSAEAMEHYNRMVNKTTSRNDNVNPDSLEKNHEIVILIEEKAPESGSDWWLGLFKLLVLNLLPDATSHGVKTDRQTEGEPWVRRKAKDQSERDLIPFIVYQIVSYK